MKEIDEEKIRRLVLESLKQIGINPAVTRQNAGSGVDGPRALIVLNSGLRRVDEALEHVRLIKKQCSKAAFFTVSSARETLCKEDIREKAGGRCILDTVSEDGVEKVLSMSDILVLPTFCFTVASKVANLIVDDSESRLLFSALAQGKKVLATKDSFSFTGLVKNERIGAEIMHILEKLKDMGINFCETQDLEKAFMELVSSDNKESQRNESNDREASMKLITAKVVTEAFEKGNQRIKLAKGGKITPLARDLAKEYSIEIVTLG